MPNRNAQPQAEADTPVSTPISATQLRANVYRILDEVLTTGQPQAVRRKGQLLLIQPAGGPRLRLAELPRREGLACSPQELIETTWDSEWVPEL